MSEMDEPGRFYRLMPLCNLHSFHYLSTSVRLTTPTLVLRTTRYLQLFNIQPLPIFPFPFTTDHYSCLPSFLSSLPNESRLSGSPGTLHFGSWGEYQHCWPGFGFLCTGMTSSIPAILPVARHVKLMLTCSSIRCIYVATYFTMSTSIRWQSFHGLSSMQLLIFPSSETCVPGIGPRS